MSKMPIELALVAVVLLAGVAVAAFFAPARPYNILRESARIALRLIAQRPLLYLFALALFIVQQAAPLALAQAFALGEWTPIVIGAVLQGALIYVLAHIAYRLHRGVIFREWKPGVTWGRAENRMGLWVLGGWAAVAALRNFPIPPPPVLSLTTAQIAAGIVVVLVFVLKAALALVGPAASLGDPAPLSRSIASFRQEPASVLAIIIGIGLAADLGVSLIFMLPQHLPKDMLVDLAIRALLVCLMTFVFVLSEIALVIALTRIWEDHYDSDTRNAAHNFDWS
ncbi:MAG: hypothetical protein KGL46_10030 [Hyphomicrobiales bacterium]|nr:hypothetical protein [Hyphomicrobiales bacterium]